MELDGKRVTHKKFGDGRILKIHGNKMDVAFPSSVRTFIYPDAFDRFFVLRDEDLEGVVKADLKKRRKIKKRKTEELRKRLELTACIKGLKIKDNSHAVFGMRPKDNNLEEVLRSGAVYTGEFASGKRKGMPRVPKNLQMNSALVLTEKFEGTKEARRLIVGIAMVPEKFDGEKCEEGLVPAHPYYRVKWGPEEEDLYFWNYFDKGDKRKTWGVSEMKYIRCEVVRHILQDMTDLTGDPEKKELLKEFCEYFAELNGLS